MVDVKEIPINEVKPNPFNPRIDLDLEDLIKSIKKLGKVIVPIKLIPIKDEKFKYEIVYGHRRYFASKELGLKTIPAIIENDGTRKILIEMGEENIPRKNLNPIELSNYFNTLIEQKIFSSAKEIAEHFQNFGNERVINEYRELREVSDNIRGKKVYAQLPYDLQFRIIQFLKKKLFSKEQELMYNTIVKHDLSGGVVREYIQQMKRLVPKNFEEILNTIDILKLKKDLAESEKRALEVNLQIYTKVKNDITWIISRVANLWDSPQEIERIVNYILAGDKEFQKIEKILEDVELGKDENTQSKLLESAEEILEKECLRLYKMANYQERIRLVEDTFRRLNKILKSSIIELAKKRYIDNSKEIFTYNVFSEEKIRPEGYGLNSFDGNCSPTVIKQCLLRYTNPPKQKLKAEIEKIRNELKKEGKELSLGVIDERDLVLDSMIGSGTTIDVCKEMQRSCIGIDLINIQKRHDINFGDARNIIGKTFKTYEGKEVKITEKCIDFIFNHFPYWDIVEYTKRYSDKPDFDRDLSLQKSLDKFLKMVEEVFKENHRVLKHGKYYAILIGNIRKNKELIPLDNYFINIGKKVGFKLHDIIIKVVGRQERKIVESHGLKYEGSKEKSNFFLSTYDTLLVFKK